MGDSQPLRSWQRTVLNLGPSANGGRVRLQLSSVATGTKGPRDSRRGHEVKIDSVLIHSRRRTIDSSDKTGSVKSDRPAREGSSSNSRIADGQRPRARSCLGDTKPENFIVDRDGKVTLVDLEQARYKGDYGWDVAE